MEGKAICRTCGTDHSDGPCKGLFHHNCEVNHPAHYGGDTVYEVIKVIEAWGLGFHLGNTVKYVGRAGKKDPVKKLEDLEKAAWYLNRYIETLKKDPLAKDV